jgi:FAD:protein FMN transferase
LRAEVRWLGLLAVLACRSANPESKGTEASTVADLAAGSPAAPAAPASPPAAALEPRILNFQRTCMGTRCTIQAYHHDQALFDRAVQSAMAEIDRLDALMSTWVPSSDVSRINAAAGTGEWISVSRETFEVLEKSLWIAQQSGGAFDVTVGAFKGLWKFDEDNDGSLPKRADVLKRLSLVDYRGLLLDAAHSRARLARAGQSLTLGGIAKGLVVDHAVAQLRAAGLVDFLMQAGGDLYAGGKRGDRDWKVGIQDPRASIREERSADTSFALLSLSDSAFNTSGDYERFILQQGKRYHHILDPRTGYPVTHTRSVSVLAPSSFLADTLDTAVFVMGAEKGLKLIESLPGVEAVIVDSHNKVHVSHGLEGRLELLRPPSDGP